MEKGENSKSGFTIIEVSLVLAIAGLIFLMVFIALPALQRSQRDAKRKEDITALVTAIKKYQTNNRGALPAETSGSFTKGGSGSDTSWKGLLNKYVEGDFTDPDGGAYTLVVNQCGGQADGDCKSSVMSDVTTKTFAANGHKIYIVREAKCAGSDAKGAMGSKNTRKIAVLYKLEGGGVFCAEN